jgi:hypothetical protein
VRRLLSGLGVKDGSDEEVRKAPLKVLPVGPA